MSGGGGARDSNSSPTASSAAKQRASQETHAKGASNGGGVAVGGNGGGGKGKQSAQPASPHHMIQSNSGNGSPPTDGNDSLLNVVDQQAMSGAGSGSTVASTAGEVAKGKEAVTSAGSAASSSRPDGFIGPITLGEKQSALRNNIASAACGAKMLGWSKDIKYAATVLNQNHDEYMNAPCISDKW